MTVFCAASRPAVAAVSRDVKVLGTVYPTYVTARGGYGEKVLKINENITLTLKSSEVLSSDFVLISHENGERRFHRVEPEAYNKHLYHDEEMQASLFVFSEDAVEVEGILSDTLRIMPKEEFRSSENRRIPHILYEITPRTNGANTKPGKKGGEKPPISGKKGPPTSR